MATLSVAVVDALNSLLEAEANSIFHYVGPGSPYLDHAGPKVRKPLEEMSRHLDQHARELTDLVRRLGGEPSNQPTPDAEDQFLSLLSLKFLLPKLVEAKELMIRRYQSVMRAVEGTPEVAQILDNHLEEIQRDLKVLKETASLVAAGKK